VSWYENLEVGIMHENITKVAERGERLDALQDKTGEWETSDKWIDGICDLVSIKRFIQCWSDMLY